tara:strand:- start:784 stop:1740 length:957 start_codon:yes stop_codon:yes gene_type:complete
MSMGLGLIQAGFELRFEVFDAVDDLSVFAFLEPRLIDRYCQSIDEYFLQGYVCLNGQIATPEQRVNKGDYIQIRFPEHREAEVDVGWKVLWENSELMAVYKPSLLPVSRTTRNLYNSLISLIRRETPYYKAQLLHRLDAETSGVMMVAKNSDADRKWKPQIKTLIQKKIYHAWVKGLPEWDEKLFECELSEKQGSAIRSQVYVVDPQTPELFLKPKLSKTGFKVLARQGDRSLIECELYTGRKHQIRVQLAHLGHPIIGDKVYSHDGYYYLKRIEKELFAEDYKVLLTPYHQLSAVSLTLFIDNRSITINADGCIDGE